MNCHRVREVVFLYTDNEMGEELLVSFRAHLSLCPECARRADYTRRLLQIVRQYCKPAPAPERLRQRILTSLPHRRSQLGGN